MIAAAEHDLKHLYEYMRDIKTETELLIMPGQTMVHYEPLGVVAVYSAWNYPVLTALKPLVQAITSGNCVVMKPSEIAPHTSTVIKDLIEQHLDNEYIRCIEGGIDVAVELNK